MRISFNWLKEYISLSESPQEIAQHLTQSGLEVVSTTPKQRKAHIPEGLLIGEIITCQKHPNADRLYVLRVNVGQERMLSIVCGAPNVAVGQRVIVAPVGVRLPTADGGTYTIKCVKIRSEHSEGMICAEEEIGLPSTQEGIMVLDTLLPPGTPAQQYFTEVLDTLLTIELTPNRGDACSHWGIARELGVLLGRPTHLPKVDSTFLGTSACPLQVILPDNLSCMRFSGVVVNDIPVCPSPLWLRERLASIGIAPINNVLDVIRFVTHELGQPIHGFDYDKLVGKQIVLKSLKAGTSFTTIDGESKSLTGTELMVCDQLGGFALAGVLGSQRTHICTTTQNLFLFSAYFDPSVVRQSARFHKLTTDASFRHERGTDPEWTVYALQRVCTLLLAITPESTFSKVVDHYPTIPILTKVLVRYARIYTLLGLKIDPEEIHRILHRLGIVVRDVSTAQFTAWVPFYRADVKREVDIIEEIIRVYGYGHIPMRDTLGSTYLAPTDLSSSHTQCVEVTSLLIANSYHELYTNALTTSTYTKLIGDHFLAQQVPIVNASSTTMDVLRTTLLFSGLEVIKHNINRKISNIKCFEFGTTYHKTAQRYWEEKRLGIWLTGNLQDVHWSQPSEAVRFKDLHAILYKILRSLGYDHFEAQPYLSPLYRSGIHISCDQTQLLTAGEVHPSIRAHMRIKQPVFYADIHWEALIRKQIVAQVYRPCSRYPTVTRDLALVVENTVRYHTIQHVVEGLRSTIIQKMILFDVYQGSHVATGEKGYALRFILQKQDGTLTDHMITSVMTLLTRAFESQLGAVIRT